MNSVMLIAALHWKNLASKCQDYRDSFEPQDGAYRSTRKTLLKVLASLNPNSLVLFSSSFGVILKRGCAFSYAGRKHSA